MAKITFVYPDYESLGVEYLMAACIRAGHDVELVFYMTGESFMDLNKKQNVVFSDIAKKVATTKPDIVAFSCVTDNYQVQLRCARAVKEIIPDVVTIFGGIHPTAVPEIVLKEKDVDCVAIGETEESFVNFLRECRFEQKPVLPQHQVNGIVFKSEGNLIGDFKEGKLSDIDTLAFPYKKPFYDSFNSFSYAYSILTSRGCPYNCSYCFNSYIHSIRGGRVVRQRKVDNVISEILQAKRTYTPKYIWFADDCFTTNETWLIEFCNRYKKEVNLPFGCVTIPSYLNKAKVQALRDAGCYHIQMGVQSLSEELCRDVLQRKSNNVKIAEAICMLRDARIIVHVDHILAFPGDTLEAEEKGVLFYNQFRPHVIGVYWLSYYPKIKITEMALHKGILNTQDIDDINAGRWRGTSFDAVADMKKYQAYYGINFMLHYLPLLPRWLVRFLITRKVYKIFAFRNDFFFVFFPSFLIALFQRKNFIHRRYFLLVLNKLFFTKKVVCKK